MTAAEIDMGSEAALFEVEKPPAVSLADKFIVPPMSVLDRRSGDWQDRKRRWLSLGMSSELGRGQVLFGGDYDVELAATADAYKQATVTAMHAAYQGGTSIFDPVVCELVYRWFTRDGGTVLDPFAGGSVRGIVASTLGRHYVGVDVREEQVEANRTQAHLGSDIAPTWLHGDSREVLVDMFDEFDLVFSCPPYADLEVYSDDPHDISTMAYPEFVEAHRDIIAKATALLRPDRFAAWVISDVRDKRTGAYRGLVSETVQAFAAAGLDLYNDAVILDQIGTTALRAERPFRATRKLARTHQHLLIFVKGDGKRAALNAGAGVA